MPPNSGRRGRARSIPQQPWDAIKMKLREAKRTKVPVYDWEKMFQTPAQEVEVHPFTGMEKPVIKAQKEKPKLTRKVLWRSPNGRQVVVCGPFPEGFFRADTRDTVEKASGFPVSAMYAHPATTREDHFAKVQAEDIVEIEPENEWGPVSP